MISVIVVVVHLLTPPPIPLEQRWKQIEKELHTIQLQERQKKAYIKLSPRRVRRACHDHTCKTCGQKLS